MDSRTQRTPVGAPGPRPAGDRPALVPLRHRSPASAAVLVLHGGRADSLAPARPWHVAALRMRPVTRAVAAAVPDGGVFLARVRYRHRGWNGSRADPVQDARQALAELTRLVGEVPVVLVGHSMGGRTALRVADAPQVRGVVALAPWCPEGEPVAQLRDRKVIVLHGDRDRVTDPQASVSFVRRARDAGSHAGVLLVKAGDHAMLRRFGTWHRATGAAVAELLTSGGPAGPADGLLAKALSAPGAGVL
ncbi:alpha/beta hydrolase [Streptomyces fagopyri]|uniref:alpha/beta hydrolase n=1 Tax=Streptomyces fagopyri TaxID=2662397 RepID=UPI0037141C28